MDRDARLRVAAVMLSGLGLVHCGSGALPVVPAVSPAAVAVAVEQPAVVAVAVAQPAAEPAPSARPKMDLVFALDTTGSMNGMIAGAKEKIWEIARRAQEGQPAPELRVGLVAYRDVGDAYVTRDLPLTSDLDQVYAVLSDFQAAGGGDGPEHVLKGLQDAVEKMPWTSDPDAVKLVYLVGDAPPHFDYQDGITLPGVLGAAAQRGIRISAIRCGNDPATLAAFTDIARPTDGEVATIEQTGGVVATAATPYDAKLVELNAKLAATELHYGTDAERADADKVVARNLAAPATAQAERASFYGARSAGAVHGATKKDLAAKPSALAALRDDELPEAMRKMSPADRARFVEEQRKKREVILAEVRTASEQRAQYLKKSAPRSPAPSALDTKVFDSMKKAARGKVAY